MFWKKKEKEADVKPPAEQYDEKSILIVLISVLEKMVKGEEINELEKILDPTIKLLFFQYRAKGSVFFENDRDYIISLISKIPTDNYSDDIKTLLSIIPHMMRESGTHTFIPSRKFGYEKTNPIMVKSIGQSYDYLDQLECENGDPIEYKRNGSIKSGSEELENLMDWYTITNSRTNQIICDLFIYAYSHINSDEIPDGFRKKR